MDAREVVKAALDNPSLLDGVPDDVDLVAAGVNSGEMIRLALFVEEELGRPLGDEELVRLTSVADVRALLDGAEEPS